MTPPALTAGGPKNVGLEYPETGPERPRIEVPDTVAVATPFAVSVITEVGGLGRGGETDVEVIGRIATITPYDYSADSGDLCTAVGVLYEHTAQVTFDAAGAATVVVRGSTEYEFAVWVE